MALVGVLVQQVRAESGDRAMRRAGRCGEHRLPRDGTVRDGTVRDGTVRDGTPPRRHCRATECEHADIILLTRRSAEPSVFRLAAARFEMYEQVFLFSASDDQAQVEADSESLDLRRLDARLGAGQLDH